MPFSALAECLMTYPDTAMREPRATSRSLSILLPNSSVLAGSKPFGKDVANRALYQALLRFGDFNEIVFLVSQMTRPDEIKNDLIGSTASKAKVSTANVVHNRVSARTGTLLRGKADLAGLAWQRRSIADAAYSLVGIIHTVAPPAVREYIAGVCTAPIQPWDALVCTSPAVRDAIQNMLLEWSAYLADRFSGTAPRLPLLPLIPLGVDAQHLREQGERSDVRSKVRAQLGLEENDIAVLWVGRLSFLEKAFPQPMFQALEIAKQETEKNVHFIMTGWFPAGLRSEEQYREAAKVHAPGVPVHFIDGRDPNVVGEMWAASDIFLSLVDNIQETFGISPVEAMAAGLPVVASDWDGYRYTIIDGVTGFLIPSLGPPPGEGMTIAARHVLGLEGYQSYVGAVAQYTAVHIRSAAKALTTLIKDQDARRAMGLAGQNHVRSNFDWPVIVSRIEQLCDELTDLRRRGVGPDVTSHVTDPVKGDPFSNFAHFATRTMSPDLPLRSGHSRPVESGAIAEIDRFASQWRATTPECLRVLEDLERSGSLSVEQIIERFPTDRQKPVMLGLMWMCKMGLIDWVE